MSYTDLKALHMSGHRIWLLLFTGTEYTCVLVHIGAHICTGMYSHMKVHTLIHTYSMRRVSDEGNVYIQAAQVRTERVLTNPRRQVYRMQPGISGNETEAAKTATAKQMEWMRCKAESREEEEGIK